MTIMGHNIIINDSDIDICSDNIEAISNAIINGDECGVIVQNGIKYEWKIDNGDKYLESIVSLLESKEKVVFEHKQVVYAMFLNSEGDYEYYMYESDDLFEILDSGELENSDGGIFTGNARDAVYYVIMG